MMELDSWHIIHSKFCGEDKIIDKASDFLGIFS